MPVITADKVGVCQDKRVGVFGIKSDSATQESNKYEREVNEIGWLVIIHISAQADDGFLAADWYVN